MQRAAEMQALIGGTISHGNDGTVSLDYDRAGLHLHFMFAEDDDDHDAFWIGRSSGASATSVA
jgi:hypothetical protein